jgi:argininosuccinate lyase
MEEFNTFIGTDRRLYAVDIRASQAYARALDGAKVLDGAEAERIISGLAQVREEFERGDFQIKPTDEDIHTAVERRLTELIGPLAGKLHTGRSRNDQVMTDIRLYLSAQIPPLRERVQGLQSAIVDRAEGHLDTVMPGFTHLQPAQPILFGHWLMAFFWKLQRDLDRLSELEHRTRDCPLGAGALAGNPFEIGREALARELGFSSISENSLDAISERDFIVEFLSWAALTQVHMSRLAEDLILWSSPGFAFVELDEAYCTGSSIMPQKRNPDALELIRGKTAGLIGRLTALLSLLKGLPSGYNKDLQEDKEGLFVAVETVSSSLTIAAGVIRSLIVNVERMEQAVSVSDGLLATELADYLVRKGEPFRKSHALVGKVLRRCEARSCQLSELPMDEYRKISPLFEPDLKGVFDVRTAIRRRSVPGGTAPDAVREQIRKARAKLSERGDKPHSQQAI